MADDKVKRGISYSAGGAYSAATLGDTFGEEKWTRYPQTIDKEYYSAIGEVAARWAWLEFKIKQDAELLAGLQVTAQEITDALKGRPSRYA